MKGKTRREIREIALMWLSGIAGIGTFFIFLYPIQPSGFEVIAAFAAGVVSSLFYHLMRGNFCG